MRRKAGGRVAGLLLGGLVAIGTAAPHPSATKVPPHVAYVSDDGTTGQGNHVVPLDTATDTPRSPITVGVDPGAMAVTPNGRTVYVDAVIGNTVTPIDTASGAAGTPISVTYPTCIGITPDGKTAYVCSFSANTVVPIDLATGSVGTPIPVGSGPDAVAITPNGKTAYVANVNDDTVTPIDLATDLPGPVITVGKWPEAIAVTPNGKTLYVADTFPVHNTQGFVTPIDVATNATLRAIQVGTRPEALAITPDGRTVYVANFDGDTVSPISTATNAAGPAFALDSQIWPSGIAITPDGTTAYVTMDEDHGLVVPFKTSTNAVEPGVTAGQVPVAIAIVPDQAPIAAFHVTAAPAGQATLFDASGSKGTTSPIKSYRWSFGDGTTQTTSSATIQHTYLSAGTYSVTLVLTDNAGTSTRQVFTGQTVSRNGSLRARAGRMVVVPG